MSKLTCPDDGLPSARLVLIGEQPGRQEELRGRPFVGPSGRLLGEWWRANGLQRSDFWITNVFSFRLPLARHVSREERAQYVDALHVKLAALSDPWLIVPTGETALRALTGKAGIGKHRGSIYAYGDRRGRDVKVIPTIHPAALFRQPSWERRCRADWRRIAGDATFRELRLPDREHAIRPTLGDVEAFVEDAAEHAECLAVDIETPRRRLVTEVAGRTKKDGTAGKLRVRVTRGERRIVCVGLSSDPSLSLTVPTTLEYWRDQAVLDRVWALLRRALTLPCGKAGHNAYAFDRWWLAQHRCDVTPLVYDTLVMHHVLNRLESHTLGYIASLFTREPFWKDDAKGETDNDDTSVEPDVPSWDAYYTYNGRDVAVTRELAETLHVELSARGLLDHYLHKYRSLFGAVHRLMLDGVRSDEERRRALARRYAALASSHGAWIEDVTGVSLFGPKGAFSAKRLMAYLYTTLRLPRHVSHGKLTANEVAVRRLARTHGQRVITQGVTFDDFAAVVIRRRAALKLAGYVKDGVADADGRVRSTYKITMLSDRFSSSKNPRGTGMNLQNQPVRLHPELREMLLPDDGHLFVSVDLAQAESRVVYAQTGDPQLVAIARSKPWEFDDHVRTAGLVFDLPADATWNGIRFPSSVTFEQRYFAKHTRHARHYGEGAGMMSESFEREGVVRDENECALWLQKLEALEPAIGAWQAEVRRRVLRDGCLTSSWGDVIDFEGERMDDQLYKRAYAWGPQLEVGSLLNHWGFRRLDEYIVKHRLRSRIRLHVHDELVVSTPADLSEAYDVVCLLREWLEQPRTYWGTTVSIPVEAKAGTSYRMTREWKRLPGRDEFNAAVRELLKEGRDDRDTNEATHGQGAGSQA